MPMGAQSGDHTLLPAAWGAVALQNQDNQLDSKPCVTKPPAAAL